MTYLNEASVLWNLKARYVAKLIYVSSHIWSIFISFAN
jgi:myosin heavy subunit